MTSDTLHGSRSPIPRKSVKYASRDTCEGMLENGTQIIGERDIVLIYAVFAVRGAQARSRAARERAQTVPGLGMEFTLNDRVATYFPAQPAAAK